MESKVTAEPRTDEDKDLHIIESIVPHLRDYPLLPPDIQDPTKSFVDMQSCKQMPALHCGFKGCLWSHRSDVIKWHFDMEELVYCHLAQDHRHKEMAMVPDSEWDDERAIPDSASTRLIPRHMHALWPTTQLLLVSGSAPICLSSGHLWTDAC